MEREELSRFQLILHEFLSLEGTLEAAAFQMSFHWDHFMVSKEIFVEPKENEARMHSEILHVFCKTLLRYPLNGDEIFLVLKLSTVVETNTVCKHEQRIKNAKKKKKKQNQRKHVEPEKLDRKGERRPCCCNYAKKEE
uniref:Uncharacterized protein n=1 Tax=Musa acuminata subsp. malaccensis TaxID=214687 RepID=A0A804KYM4_MUSAM